MNTYQYSPLDARECSIRLLRLRKGANTTNVECDIFHDFTDHPSGPPYEALSYVWGNTELVEHIEVDGRRLYITENLLAALQCLRLHDRDRILWVDAICINQADKVEQSRQVRAMGRIFSSASRVIFWLGKPTVEIELLMESLGELQAEYTTSSQAGISADGKSWEKLWSSVQSRHKAPDNEISSHMRKGLQVLLRRPWFGRVWILQEVYNAQAAVVCTGTLSVPADIFVIAFSLLGQNASQHIQSILAMMPRSIDLDRRNRQAPKDLFNLFSRFRTCKATDQRDMIYALLAMSSESSSHELLRADYTKSLAEVLHNTVRYWLAQTNLSVNQALDFLADFETVRTTLLVLPTSSTHEQEILRVKWLPMTRWGECIRDASLFVLGQHGDESVGEQNTFHSELDRLHKALDSPDRAPDSSHGDKVRIGNGVSIFPWSDTKSGIDILVVETNASELLLMLYEEEYTQMFAFMMDSIIKHDSNLLNCALFEAVGRNNDKLVQVFLDKGADANKVRDKHNNTALHVASKDGNLRIVQMLLEKGANINAKDKSHYTALHLAISRKCTRVVQIPTDEGSDISVRTHYGGNLIPRSTVSIGDEEMVQLLLDKGADVDASWRGDESVLYVASIYGNERIVQMLLDKGADVHVQSDLSGSVLRVASENGYEKVVRMLLDKGADVNVQEGYGGVLSTALQEASRRGHETVVQILLDHGANINAHGGRIGNSLEAAAIKGYKNVMRILVEHGATSQAGWVDQVW